MLTDEQIDKTIASIASLWDNLDSIQDELHTKLADYAISNAKEHLKLIKKDILFFQDLKQIQTVI